MTSKLIVVFFFVWMLSPGQALPDFLNCPGNEPVWWKPWMYLTRRCCHSNQLPNGCECFDISSNSQFRNTNWFKPECPDDINVIFTVFSRDTKHRPRRVISTQELSTFDPSLKTYVITHGYKSSSASPHVRGIKNELAKLGPSNIVLVDWSGGADTANYIQALANTRTVGAVVARLLHAMHGRGASLEHIHMIGHSLGAHTMGLAGQEVKRLTGGKVGRVTGFDPAGPMCDDEPDIVILDRSDAAFVDIIHTDTEWMGITSSTGHADFWPNGGSHQPGCSGALFSSVRHGDSTDEGKRLKTEEVPPANREHPWNNKMSRDLAGRQNNSPWHPSVSNKLNNKSSRLPVVWPSGMLSTAHADVTPFGSIGCNHGRAPFLFMHSIAQCKFLSVSGDGQVCPMGFHAQPGCRGVFHVTTAAKPPFC